MVIGCNFPHFAWKITPYIRKRSVGYAKPLCCLTEDKYFDEFMSFFWQKIVIISKKLSFGHCKTHLKRKMTPNLRTQLNAP